MLQSIKNVWTLCWHVLSLSSPLVHVHQCRGAMFFVFWCLYFLFLSLLYSGITDRNLPRDNPIRPETSTSGKSNSSSSQLTNTETLRKKKRYSQFLTFMDGKVPIRKMVSIILSLVIISITLFYLFLVMMVDS